MPGPSEETVVSELRAALLSSKTPLRIQDVNTDYKVLNGYSIPFREFGHKSLEEFLTKLKERGDITMKYEGGSLMVHAQPKGTSAHVTSMISKQKPSKKRAGGFRGRGGRGGRSGRGGSYGSRPSYREYKPPASTYRPAPRAVSSYSNYRAAPKPLSQPTSSYSSGSRRAPEQSVQSRLSSARLMNALTAPSDNGYFVHKTLLKHLGSSLEQNNNSQSVKHGSYQNGHCAEKDKPKSYDDDFCQIVDPDVEIIKIVKPAPRHHSKFNDFANLPPRLQKRLGVKIDDGKEDFANLPPRLQKRLGDKIDDGKEVNNSHSSSPEAYERVRKEDNGWERRVVMFDSSPPAKHEDKSTLHGEHKALNAQTSTRHSESLAPRFQKQLEQSASYKSTVESPSVLPQPEPVNNRSPEDSTQGSGKMLRGPAGVLARAKENQAKKNQELLQEQKGASGYASSSGRLQSHHNLHLGNPPPMNSAPLQGFNPTWESQALFAPQMLTPMTVTTLVNSPQLAIPNSYQVNPGQLNYIPFSQLSSNNFQYHANGQPSQTQLMNGTNFTNGQSIPQNLLTNDINFANGASSAQNVSKPISGGKQRSATPAQDRLKNIQLKNPDPKPPVPSALPKISEDRLSGLPNDVQNLVSSIGLMQVKDNQQISDQHPGSSPVSYVEQLFHLAEKLKYPTPSFKMLSRYCKTERKTLFATVVTLDPNKKYSCAPEEYSSPEEAQEAAAKVAFLDLTKKSLLPAKKLRPVSTASSFVLATRIAHLLEGQQHGIWSDEAASMYIRKFQESLPENWVQLVEESSELEVIHVGGRAIISPKTASSSPKFPSPPPLVLPEVPHWDVYITLPISTKEVWFRLIGDDYSEKWDRLMDEMELTYKSKPTEDYVKNPEVGNFYVVEIGDEWFRVQLVGKEDGSCKCHLIDIGNTDVFRPENLYKIDPIHLKFPAQAVKCSLFGLEKYADDPISEEYLKLIEGQSFVAEVKSRSEPYSLELYDTSSDENIHMGEEMLQKVDAENSAPVMPPVGSIQRDVKTYISHVSDTGEIWLQFHTNHFKILLALIEDITPEIVQANQITDLARIDQEKLYLAKFSDDEWYRAAITNINSKDDIEVFYIDYGNSHTVSLSELISLDQLPTFLSLILPQAILVHLESINGSLFSAKVAEKIRELVPDDTEVLVKRVTNDETPKVEIFIRMPPSNILASINNTILVDPELNFSKNEEEILDGNVEDTCSPEDSGPASRQSSETSPASPLIGVVAPLVNTNLKIDAKPFIPRTSSIDEQDQTNDDPVAAAEDKSTKPNESSAGLSDLQPFELPKTADGTLHVYVMNVANPHNFSIQTEESRKILENLEKEMSNFYTKYPMSKKKNLEIGQTYAVQLMNGKWQRFTITSFLEAAQCIGSFPDTGGLQIVAVQDIFPLMPTYKQGAYKPALSTSAKLVGISPKCKDWDVMDTLQFQSMVQEKKLKCSIVSNIKNQLEIELFDCSGSEEKNIGQLLISRKCAIRSS